MFRIAICDNDPLVSEGLKKTITSYATENALEVMVKSFFSGEAFVSYMKENHGFDLIFLDIELDSTTGIWVGQEIREGLGDYFTKIVFISSKSGYEMALFEVQPMHFLRKPLSEEKIIECIHLAMKILEKESQYFVYEAKHSAVKVQYRDILYFESKLKKMEIVTTNGKDTFVGSMEKTKEALPSSFLYAHGSFIVNFHHIQRMSKEELELTNGEKIPVSRRHYKELKEAQLQLAKERRKHHV